MPGRSLAQFLQSTLSDYKSSLNLNFDNQKITQIGIIKPDIASTIYHLSLKNNHLKSIQGISQFTSLQSLDLSYNKISSTHSLFELKNLFHLKKLSLKGNPFLQNPLSEQILTFLGGFQNDLSILNFALANESREALINFHKRNKSQTKSQSSKISGSSKVSEHSKISDQSKKSDKSNVKISRSRYEQPVKPKDNEATRNIQASKAIMLLKNMKQFIEQGHESQEMSSESIHGEVNYQNSVFVDETSCFRNEQEGKQQTPMKKSPKFRSFAVDDKTISDANLTMKFQEESTGFKGRTLNKSKDTLLDELFSSNHQSAIVTTQEKPISVHPANNHGFRKPQSKQLQYQVDNLNIKMQMESVNMNCPSIIEKEDHDSYEIEFDFMSPQRYSRKISSSLKASPANKLKQPISSEIKIQQDEITLNNYENSIKKDTYTKIRKSPKVQTPKTPNETLSRLLNRKQGPQQKIISKTIEKENIIENIEKPKQQVIFSKRGSLYESARHLVPQTNNSTANELISKLLVGRQKNQNNNDSISLFAGFSLEQMIESGQKFDKFYYNSLTKLKPVFNLLYSPFSSLKTDEKDMLLQELFKNHKQIFILFIREYHTKQQLQDQIRFKDQDIDSQNLDIQQLNEKVLYLGDKLNEYNEKYHNLHGIITNLEIENAKYKKQANQFDEILAVRQKLINDVKLQYEKANKAAIKKNIQIQKFLNQDQVEEKIEKMHEKKIKKSFLVLVNKKASKVMKLQEFQTKRQLKQQKTEQKRNNSLKILVFQAFQRNYKKEKGLKHIQQRTNFHMLSDFFYEWKIESLITKSSNKVEKLVNRSRKIDFLEGLFNFSLSQRRNRKIQNFRSIRLKRKVLFQGFKLLRDEERSKKNQNMTKAVKFNNRNLLREFFRMLILSKSILNDQRNKKQIKISPMILKRQLYLLRRLVWFQKKQDERIAEYIKVNIIKVLESKLLIKIMKNQLEKCSRFRKGLKIAINYRLKKLFKGFKGITGNVIKKYRKMKPFIYKAAQQQRLKVLITKFRQGTLKNKIQQKQKSFFYQCFQKIHLIKTQYELKKTELQCYLSFRRGFKAKNNFISILRHKNILRRIKKKENILSEHYQMQDLKYKEGHELNMFTLDQLKAEIQTYLNEINCYKVQVQILAQRQQFLLDQKQNCLLQMQSREQQNLELKTILIENEKKLNQLEKKYEKSLDMYAAAMTEADQKSAALQMSKSTFLYDTITGGRQPATFRKDVNETTFTSLKR